MTRLWISPNALREIADIHAYIARIYSVMDSLVAHPRMGHETVTRGLRMFVVGHYPYLIFYRYRPRLDELHVERVRHAARRRPALREDETEFRAAVS